MSVHLSEIERRNLISAQRAMLSPLAYEDFSAWQFGVNKGIRDLVHADHHITYLWDENGLEFYSDDTEIEWLFPLRKRFLGYDEDGNATFEPDPGQPPGSLFAEKAHRVRRMSGSLALSDLQISDATEMKKTDLFQETHVPAGMCFMVGLGTRLPVGEVTTCLAFERHDANGYGEESIHMLELLVPAYERGIQVWQSAGGYRDMLDAIGAAIVVLGPDEKVLFENRAFDRLMASEPECDLLTEAVRREVRPLLSLRRVRRKSARTDDTPIGEISTGSNTYDILSSRLRYSVFGMQAVLVILKPRSPVLPGRNAVKRRFGLTPRESEVADLIARGLDNRTIADRLFISPHTARRHTERILAKLDIDSRAAVAITLIQAD